MSRGRGGVCLSVARVRPNASAVDLHYILGLSSGSRWLRARFLIICSSL